MDSLVLILRDFGRQIINKIFKFICCKQFQGHEEKWEKNNAHACFSVQICYLFSSVCFPLFLLFISIPKYPPQRKEVNQIIDDSWNYLKPQILTYISDCGDKTSNILNVTKISGRIQSRGWWFVISNEVFSIGTSFWFLTGLLIGWLNLTKYALYLLSCFCALYFLIFFSCSDLEKLASDDKTMEYFTSYCRSNKARK